MAKLAGDELYQARMRKAEAEHASYSRALARDAAPLLDELRNLGYNLESVWALVNSANTYDKAIPVLVRHLDREYHPGNVEGIVRALTIQKARGIAGAPLLALFRESRLDADLRWVVGNALSVVATKSEVSEIVDLLEDRAYGASRGMLVFAVVRLMDAEAIPLLVPRLYEEGMAFSAIRVLGNLRAREARQEIEAFVESADGELRQEARKALRKIDGAIMKKG